MKIDNNKQWVINKNPRTKDWVIGIKFGTGVDAFVINSEKVFKSGFII